MQGAMLRLDAFLRRRRSVVLAIWVALFAAAVPLALHQSDNLTGGGFSVPGSQSKQVEESLQRDFGPRERAASMGAVLVPARNATPAQIRATLDELATAVKRVDHVALPAKVRAAALRRARPGTPLVVPLAVATDEFGASDVASDLREELGLNDRKAGAVGLHLIGQSALWAGLQDESKADLAAAETTGFPIVLMILLAVFGSLAAASLPLVLGVVSVLVTGALIYLLSGVIDMNVFVTNMASMIGIGVAVDYSLFVLARYREELAHGHAPDRARAIAMATSGVAVLFSGLTVVVSLAGLLLVRTSALQSMALGAILVVLVSMLASATLLPILMSLLGKRASVRGPIVAGIARAIANRRPWRRGSTHPDAPVRAPVFERLAGAVMRRPVVAAVAASSVLIALALPALGFKTGDGALRQFPAGNETRAGFEAAASVSSPGESSPIKVLVDRGDAKAARTTLKADREIMRVSGRIPAQSGERVLLRVIPRHDGEAEETKALVSRLRDTLPAGAIVGGNPAAEKDFGTTLRNSMWKIVLFVVALCYLVLLVLLRSVVLPLKAVVMNLLSVGAAYGVLTIVFVWGWFDGFLGFQSPGYVDTLTPPLVLAVVFGLSMDYEVFLLSRIRERFNATGDTRRAVGEGLAASARTITSAALIMVAVFAVFVGTGLPSIKQIGLGNAVAIAVDATLVRLILVPAAMELLGKWNWYLPRGLARVLPKGSFEELPARA
jgi:uncharacterized membrane protein YdfJ with MMPL/SSD domain